MIRLLQIELIKLWNNRASKILIILSFLLPFTVAALTSIKIDLGFLKLNPAEYGIFDFPFIWHWNGYFASCFKIFFALVAISMIANEYNYRTLKQNLIDGLSKKEVILSKFYVIVLYSLVATLGISIMSLTIGFIYSSYTEIGIVFTDVIFLLGYFLKLVAFFTFCLFITMLVKRSIFTIGVVLILSALEWFIYARLRWPSDESETYAFAENISQFFPLMSMYNLIEQPFIRYGLKAAQGNIGMSYNYAVHWQEILIVIGWTGIFLLLSYTLLKKRDL